MNKQSVRLSAVGDISFGDFSFCVGYGVRSVTKSKESKFIFREIKDSFKNSDLVFGNLETTLSLKGLKEGKLKSVEMRGHPSMAECLADSQFNVLNVANNHALQHGEEAFFETNTFLANQGISQVGIAGEKYWFSKPVILKAKGLTFGFLGYAFESDKYFKGPLSYAFGGWEPIEHDVKKLRPDVDYLIVSCHWGVEFMDSPSPSNIRLGRHIIDWGVDVILGHHPHVLQGIERHKNGIICYSLGNFLFDMHWDDIFKRGMIVDFYFEKGQPIRFNVHPVKINQDYQPVPGTEKETKEFILFLEKLNKRINDFSNGDNEENSLNYYLSFERIRKKNRLKCYKYFFFNIYRCSPVMVWQIIFRTFSRRIEDLKHLFRKVLPI